MERSISAKRYDALMLLSGNNFLNLVFEDVTLSCYQKRDCCVTWTQAAVVDKDGRKARYAGAQQAGERACAQAWREGEPNRSERAASRSPNERAAAERTALIVASRKGV